MKHKFLLFYICIITAACMLICSACGHEYELVLSDSSSESGSKAAEAGTAEYMDHTPDAGAESVEPEHSDSNHQAEQIYVYVCGAVNEPGVYLLPAGSRVYEAIDAAGGLTDDAEPRALNQAQLLEDGEQITVLTREEAENSQTGAAGKSMPDSGEADSKTDTDTEKVNLNTADKEELMTLSGIGEARADAILAYRQEHGGFSSTEEIMQIDGIGEKSYGKLKDRITV